VGLREPTLKMMRLGIDQARWIEKEADRLGIAESELIRQAIERLRRGPPAVFRWEALRPRRPPGEYYRQKGIGYPPREDVHKLVRLERRAVRWIRAESKTIGVSHRDLIRQAIERLQAGPPAELPSSRCSLWRRRDWLYTMTASESLEREWERYRLREASRGRPES
jgi:hypothetical protein